MQVNLTPAVKTIMIACFVAFIAQQTGDRWFGSDFLSWFGLIPSSVVIGLKFWQLFTYAFLHTGVWHLVFNLLMLAFIGGEIEALWGTRRFVKYYFACSVASGLFYLLLQLLVWKDHFQPMVGASGAIYGLLIAYGILFGERVMLFMMLFPMKAKHFVWILAGIEFYTSVFAGRGGLASAAHLGGMGAGFLYLWGETALRINAGRREGKREKKRKAAKHLKLVINKGTGPENPEDQDEEPRTWH